MCKKKNIKIVSTFRNERRKRYDKVSNHRTVALNRHMPVSATAAVQLKSSVLT